MMQLLTDTLVAALLDAFARQEVTRMEREAAARQVEWDAQRERTDRYVEGLKLTGPGFVDVLVREQSLRYVAPLLGEHELRGALDGYEQAMRPRCPCCMQGLDIERELLPNPSSN